MEIRFPAPRPGKISQHFVDKLRKYGASATLLRDLAPHNEKDTNMVKLPSFVGMLDSGDPDFSKKAKHIARGISMEEVATVDLNYAEICTLLDSGTVVEGSPLYVKLRTARDVFLRMPKVYGKGYSMKSKESK